MIVYKAVRKVSNGDGGDKLVSINSEGDPRYELEYAINKTTTPNFGLIFVFETLYKARQFANGYYGGEVLECKAPDNLIRIMYIARIATHYKRFWRYFYSYIDQKFKDIGDTTIDLYSAPYFSYGAEWIKPLKIMPKEEQGNENN